MHEPRGASLSVVGAGGRARVAFGGAEHDVEVRARSSLLRSELSVAVDGVVALAVPGGGRTRRRGGHSFEAAGAHLELRWVGSVVTGAPRALVLLEGQRVLAAFGDAPAVRDAASPGFHAEGRSRATLVATTVLLTALVLLPATLALALASWRSFAPWQTARVDDLEAVGPADAEQIARVALRNTVVVVAVAGERAQRGTGFVFRRFDDLAVVATNAHVVLDDDERLFGRIAVRSRDGEVAGEGYLAAEPVVYLHRIPDTDVAFLAVLDREHRLGQASRIGAPASVGQYVVCTGNPKGLDFVVSSGHVLATNPTKSLVEHDCATAKGSSGGPLFGSSGQVVGMHTYGVPDGKRFALDMTRFELSVVLERVTVDPRRGWQESGVFVRRGAVATIVGFGAYAAGDADGGGEVEASGRADAALAPRAPNPSLPFGAAICQVGRGPVRAVSERVLVAGVEGRPRTTFPGGPSGALRCRANLPEGSGASGTLDLVVAVTE